jgi:hypothetical protein
MIYYAKLMKLDYIHHINAYGDHVVRLYDFNKAQATQFRDAVQQHLLVDKKTLKLSTLDFIESRNCSLTLRLSEEDLGITSSNGKQFYCDLSPEGYVNMIKLLEPFCKKETISFQMLYDVDSLTDFLFSPAGTW